MSGHNRWSKIKHKKGASDAKKSKVWTKVIKEITISARSSGDVGGNPRLRAAVDKARAVNMPNDTIERAIKKGTGELGGVTYEEFNFEAYGPGRYGDLDGDHDRQPQPDHRRDSFLAHQEQRQPGQLGLGGVHVQEAGCHRLRASPRSARTR